MKIFQLLDDFIVLTAKAVIRVVFAIGTGLVYVQFLGGLLLAASLSSIVVLMVFAALRSAFHGA
ncbi:MULTISPECIES: hypothetical protein [Xanthomonas]|uniref:hypothetical protein n=1 Tax=Xanthomonas TaxID=338 RepID=UPI002377ED6B|nr:hypothetical protein [Xanthomonas campestris]WDK04495.1 hypothetical protein JH273_21480 [Xanthomonas campestris]